MEIAAEKSTKKKCNANRKNKYSHVESKVKQYREMLHEETNRNKAKCKEENKIVISEIDLLKSELEISKKSFEVLEEEFEIISRKYTQQQINYEKLRLENARLQQTLNTISCTPKAKGNPIFILQSPFNVITNALKTPRNNISEYSVSESDICSEDIINVSYTNTSLEMTNHDNTPNIHTLNDAKLLNNVSQRSDEPLLNQTNKKTFGQRAKKVLLKYIICNKQNNSICSDINTEQFKYNENKKIRTVVKPRLSLKKRKNTKKYKTIPILSSSTPSFPLSAIKLKKK